MKLLLVVDDPPRASLLNRALVEEGHVVDICRRLDAVDQASDRSHELGIVELGSAGGTGEPQLLADLRAANPGLRFVLLLPGAAIASQPPSWRGPEVVHWLTKPVSLVELVHRLRALAPPARRPENLLLVALERRARIGDRWLELTPREFQLLELLAGRPGHVFSRTEIIEKLWDSRVELNHSSVDAHVARLRRKLGAGASCLRSVRGVGYVLLPAAFEPGDLLD